MSGTAEKHYHQKSCNGKKLGKLHRSKRKRHITAKGAAKLSHPNNWFVSKLGQAKRAPRSNICIEQRRPWGEITERPLRVLVGKLCEFDLQP